MVPVAGRDLPGRPFQSPAGARSDQAGAGPGGRPGESPLVGVRGRGGGGGPAGQCQPGVSPVNSLLVVVSGRVRVVEPTVNCQPVAPAGAWVGSFTVRVVPLTFR